MSMVVFLCCPDCMVFSVVAREFRGSYLFAPGNIFFVILGWATLFLLVMGMLNVRGDILSVCSEQQNL